MMGESTAAGIRLIETLPVATEYGEKKIELHFGSITQQPILEPIDVILVSAFPGDYSAIRRTVIGALKYDLGINVGQLAREHKEEDLRKLFSCWYTKPLPKGLPYKRLMCFEGSFKKGARPPQVVGEVFRSLISLCEAQQLSDLSVITPLLASGDQGNSQRLMLRLMVNSALHWMKIGLKMEVLKIVLFTTSPDKPGKSLLELAEYFVSLKDKFLKKNPAIEVQSGFAFDVYLSYSKENQLVADSVKRSLKQAKKDVRIFAVLQKVDEEKSWQEEIYKTMVTCQKVMALLSPEYLSDAACIEQYNMALCCSRKMNRNFLTPLYVNEIEQMPSYMALIQYADCRPFDVEKIGSICAEISTMFTLIVEVEHSPQKMKQEDHHGDDDSYDLFISYAHKDSELVNEFYEYLTIQRPNWQFFIDQSGLKTGHSWQKKLYTSIEKSRNVVAVLSESYVASKVCQEEYNLACSMCDDNNFNLELIRIDISENDNYLPQWCAHGYAPKTMNKASFQHALNLIDISRDDNGGGMKEVIQIDSQLSQWRDTLHTHNYPLIENVDLTGYTPLRLDDEGLFKFDVMLSYHEKDTNFTLVYLEYLKKCFPSANIYSGCGSVHLQDLDHAQLIVPFLSLNYINDLNLMEEFNIALFRHRFSERLVLFPIIIEEIPTTGIPAYMKLVFCLFSCEDNFWSKEISNEHMEYLRSYNFEEDKGSIRRETVACLETAATVTANVISLDVKVEGCFKTLLSIQELEQWCLAIVRDGSLPNFKPMQFLGERPRSQGNNEKSNSEEALAGEDLHNSESKNKNDNSEPKLDTIDTPVSIQVGSEMKENIVEEAEVNKSVITDPKEPKAPDSSKAENSENSCFNNSDSLHFGELKTLDINNTCEASHMEKCDSSQPEESNPPDISETDNILKPHTKELLEETKLPDRTKTEDGAKDNTKILETSQLEEEKKSSDPDANKDVTDETSTDTTELTLKEQLTTTDNTGSTYSLITPEAGRTDTIYRRSVPINTVDDDDVAIARESDEIARHHGRSSACCML